MVVWNNPHIGKICVRVEIILSYLHFAYLCDILTDMKKLLITFDDETANLLEGKPNMSQTVRDALVIYREDISTDTLAGIKHSFAIILKRQKELEAQMLYLIETVEKLPNRMRELQ